VTSRLSAPHDDVTVTPRNHAVGYAAVVTLLTRIIATDFDSINFCDIYDEKQHFSSHELMIAEKP
jgi:hypothetical protein